MIHHKIVEEVFIFQMIINVNVDSTTNVKNETYKFIQSLNNQSFEVYTCVYTDFSRFKLPFIQELLGLCGFQKSIHLRRTWLPL